MKKYGGMASVRKLADEYKVVVAPPTIIPPLASIFANEATTNGDVASKIYAEAHASMVSPSTIVPPTIVVNEATTSIGDVAATGADDDVFS